MYNEPINDKHRAQHKLKEKQKSTKVDQKIFLNKIEFGPNVMESSQSENSVRQISQANHLLQSESDAQDKGIKSIYQIIKPRKQNKLVFILKTDRRSIKII